MPRGPLRFRQRDVSATLRALKEAGVSVARIDVNKDGVTIVPGEPAKKPNNDIEAQTARLDEKFRRRAAKR